MTSTLTLSPCSPSSEVTGVWPLVRSCSTLAFTDDNGPQLVSPQYRPPPPSPRPGSSIKLGDGRKITIAWHLSPTVRRVETRVCADDIPSPPRPSLFRQFTMMLTSYLTCRKDI